MDDTRQRDALVRTLSEFARTLLVTYDIDFVLDTLLTQLTGSLGLTGAGISLAKGDRLQDTHASSADLSRLEDVQLATSTGPCAVAFRTGEPVVVPDLAEWTSRWPRYCEVAAELGIHSVAGLPMRLGDQTFGALNLYDATPRDWTTEDLDFAGLVRDMACGYFVNVTKLNQQQELTEQLQGALRTRVVIEQAKGMLASAENITLQQAFERIRRMARSRQRPLRDIARELVQTLEP
jgi:GAF domain-containing protein